MPSVAAHTYRYQAPSRLLGGTQPQLSLATSTPGTAPHPHFFRGSLVHTRLFAEGLTAVHRIVGTRFFTPPNMVRRAIMQADPVVTSGGGLLRFEGFSSCCSAYIRLDLLPEGYDGEVVRPGTTNVDFNAPMRSALAQIREAQPLTLEVGSEAFALHSAGGAVIEKKVALPLRWLRGMLEVQAYQAALQPRFTITGAEAMRFVRGLPKSSTRHTPLWVVRGPQGLTTTTLACADGVRLTEAARLRVLEPLLPRVRRLTALADECQQASGWLLELPGMRLTLLLSAEVWRGFSGEGQALRALLRGTDDGTLARVRATLNWQGSLNAGALGATLNAPPPAVADCLTALGACGLAGFDVATGEYFHRVLPFDLAFAEDMHPRLNDARALLAAGAVSLIKTSPLHAQVRSGDVDYVVREVEGECRCTCPWFAKHQGERGPCKHVLAAEASVTQGMPS